ncbi:MAG: hypothetical protein KDB26_02365 [Microthrixaceae bacterium]|nr:hypothetical protein [Microthrixaceae bacterium]
MTDPRSLPKLLLVTDLSYQAAGRRYCDEDITLSAQLAGRFRIASCHPRDAALFMDDVDVVLVRNTGPVFNHLEAYDSYRARVRELGVPLYTEPTGKGDQGGKQYLVDLTVVSYPVIPTVDSAANLDQLPEAEQYVVKPKHGADSVGLRFVTRAEVATVAEDDVLIQPRIDFVHEVSFYFVDREFQYALHTPDPAKRWELAPYIPSAADIDFAQQFIDWNTIDHGIQRVDACRTQQGELLLVELEDLNPYLSLDKVAPEQQEHFVEALAQSLMSLIGR